MTGYEILELLKIIHCSFDYKTGYKILEVETWPCKDEYERILTSLRRDLFDGLCRLDSQNLERIFKWAKQKSTTYV